MIFTLMAGLVLAATTPITAPGPNAPLAGTLVDAGRSAPTVVIVPGSGPTDRDGNNPLGVTAAPYRLLAEALAGKGISTVRIDKRGMFGSKAAIADPNAVTIADYAGDARAWTKVAAARAGTSCAWLLGHSEGGLAVLRAAQDPRGICGIILVAAPGHRLADVMREQFRANPANAPILAPALAAIDALESGRRVDPATLPGPLAGIFNASVQGFLIDMFAQDPAKLAAAVRLPILIVQGERDLQVQPTDARALASANPYAKLVLLPDVNHVLKTVENQDRAANQATYADPSLPVASSLVEAIAQFVTAKR